MKYTKIPENTFKTIQLNAGVLLTSFDPANATVEDTNIMGATTGGVQFNATHNSTDFGEDIDNCPKNTMELRKHDSWDIQMSGTFVTISAATATKLVGAADADADDATHIVPRNDFDTTKDYSDVWWVGDYSDQNGNTNGGYVAIHMMHANSTGGFQLQSSDKAKGQFAFTYTAHYSISEQEKVPFEVYVKAGTAETDSASSTDISGS